MDQVLHVRCNGSMLSNLKGKKVCLMGKVISVDRTQGSFVVTSSDDKNIKIKMKDQVLTYPKGLTEVCGIVDMSGGIICETFTSFDEENTTQFDMGQYNEAINLISKLPNYYISKS